MKYYLIELTTYNNGTNPAKAIYEFNSLDGENSAMSSYYKKLGGSMDNPIYATEMLMVIDSTGSVCAYNYYVRPIEPEPTPEPTEE